MSASCRQTCLLVAWLVICSCSVGPARAGSGSLQTTPQNGRPGKAGLLLTIDDRWVGDRGYAPVKCVLTSTRAMNGDRNFTIVCRLSGMYDYRPYNYRSAMEVTQNLRIPAGATSGTAEFYLPRSCAVESYQFHLLYGGESLLELAQSRSANDGMGGQEDVPSILVCGTPEDTPRLESLFEALQIQNVQYPQSVDVGEAALPPVYSNAELSQRSRKLHFVPLAELPTDWLPYTAADVIVASWAQLQQLEQERPQVLSAIDRWTQSGGNLVVHGVVANDDKADFDARASSAIEVVRPVEQLFRISPPGQWGDQLASDWRRADPRDLSEHVAGAAASSGYVDYATLESESEPDLIPPEVTRRQLAALRGKSPFAWREHGFGTVLVIYQPLLGSEQPPFWAWIFNTLGNERWKWRDRHSVTYLAENRHFRNLLIPGVGLAPTTAFQVLITMFVVLIGPVLYFVAIRTRRLHYLLFVVPAAAAFVCVSLFAYALFADGLGLRQRVRSFTHLDQAAGRAVTWSRLSYYAGLAPGDGLRFSAETAVYPLPPDVQRVTNVRRMTWDDRQRLEDGWLPSRTPTQLIAIKPEDTTLGLTFEPIDGEVNVVNRFGEQVRLVIFRDDQGKYFRGSTMVKDASARATELTATDAKRELMELFRDSRLKEEVGAVATGGAFNQSYYYDDYYGGYGEDIGDGDSRLERAIHVALRIAAPDLARRSYVAVLERSPFVEPGHDRAREELSFHLVQGTW